MKASSLFLTLFLLCSGTFLAQTKITSQQYETFKRIPQEKIHIHSSNQFLLTGETVYYKVYCRLQDNTKSSLSTYAYVELVNSNKRVVLQQKVQLHAGEGQGDIFIPGNLSSGVYKLIGYTKWMKNKNLFSQENITIVNPFTQATVTAKSSEKKSPSLLTSSGKFGLSKAQFSKKEKINLSFKNLDKQLQGGTFSLSVKKAAPSTAISQSSNITSNTPKNILENNTVFLPEFRGELIQGKITATSKETSVKNIQIGLSIVQKNGIFKIVTTDNEGNFYFNLDENYNGDLAYIQILGEGDFTIQIFKNKGLDYSKLSFPKFSLNNINIAQINKRAIYMQIENAYSSAKQDSIVPTQHKSVIFGDDVITYKLDDYKRFNTIRETFIEVITNAWVKKIENGYMFRAKKKDFSIKDPKALLIVDGYIVKNHGEIIDFNPRKIKQVTIYKKDYKINSKIYQGIIYIETFKLDYTPKRQTNIITHNLLQPTQVKKYFSPNYARKNTKRIPDYRTQLAWVPQLNVNTTTAFYTSDVTGDFEIVLDGYTKNGKHINIRETIRVK